MADSKDAEAGLIATRDLLLTVADADSKLCLLAKAGDLKIEDIPKFLSTDVAEAVYNAVALKAGMSSAPGGIFVMLWAHYEAPMKAAKGDAEGAVSSAVGGSAAIMGGVVAAAAGGGAAALLAGAAVAFVVPLAAVGLIRIFGKSKTLCYKVIVNNYTKYNVYLDPACKHRKRMHLGGVGDIDTTYAYGEGQGYYSKKKGPEDLWNMGGGAGKPIMIPAMGGLNANALKDIAKKKGAKEDVKNIVGTGLTKGSVKICAWSYKIDEYHSHHQAFSTRWIGVDPALKVKSVRKDVHKNRKNIKVSWAVGCQAESPHYSYINKRSGDGARGHVYAYDNMVHQKEGGAGNGDSCIIKGDLKESECYWSKDFKTLVVNLF